MKVVNVAAGLCNRNSKSKPGSVEGIIVNERESAPCATSLIQISPPGHPPTDNFTLRKRRTQRETAKQSKYAKGDFEQERTEATEKCHMIGKTEGF